LARWLPDHPDQTVAVLVPRNDRGFAVVAALKQYAIEPVELLRSSRSTRETAGALGNLLAHLADPASPKKLATVFEVWRRDERSEPDSNARLQAIKGVLRKCPQVESFLWPRAEADWLAIAPLPEGLADARDELAAFRDLARRWQGVALLPIDQAILTLAGDLFTRPAELAVAHKLAVALRQAAESHPHWRLPELTEELATIARNERKFLGF